MIQNFLYMNGYGLFVWAAFSITFISCGIVFYKTQKTLKKYEREFVKEINDFPEVIECHYTTGNWSILIKILCEDNQHLMNVLNHKIQTIEGVSRTETFISLNQQIKRQIQL